MSKYSFKFVTGFAVLCRITAFTGVITTATRYLTGCNRYCVLPCGLKDGRPQESCWLEEYRLAPAPVLDHGLETGPKTINFLFEPGDRVEDAVTHFSGIIVAATTCWNSSNRYALAKSNPKDMKDDREWLYFDESELMLEKAEAVQLHRSVADTYAPGGPALSEAPRIQ